MNLLELRILGICGAVVALWIGYGLWHHKVYQEGYDACQAAQTKAVEEGKKQYAKDSEKNAKLSDDRARLKYCQFVRDASLSVCLRDLKPFSP